MSVVNPRKPAPRGKHASQGGWKRQAAYLTMVLPGVIFLLMFCYLPMPGIVLAFKNYQIEGTTLLSVPSLFTLPSSTKVEVWRCNHRHLDNTVLLHTQILF